MPKRKKSATEKRKENLAAAKKATARLAELRETTGWLERERIRKMKATCERKRNAKNKENY